MTSTNQVTGKVANPLPAKTDRAKRRLQASIALPPDKERAKAIAKAALKPSINAAAVVADFAKSLCDPDVGALAVSMGEGIERIWEGDLKRPEAMLYAQAEALQSIFVNFSRRALCQDYQKSMEVFMRMALKAQNQCRMTLETLATIKNPPVVYAKQANFNNGGQQQVNNGPPTPSTNTHTAKPRTDANKLLEASNGERLDFGAQGQAVGVDPRMDAVAKVNRTADR